MGTSQAFKFLLPSEKKFIQITINKPMKLEDLKYYFEKVLGYRFFGIELMYYLDGKKVEDSLTLFDVRDMVNPPKEIIELTVELNFD